MAFERKKSTPEQKAEGRKKAARNRHGLSCNELPKGCTHLELKSNVIRRNLEQAVLELKGKISLTDAAHINSAIRWERHAGVTAWHLKKNADGLSGPDFLKFSHAIARASSERDRAIRMLNLEPTDDATQWADLTDTDGDSDDDT